MKPDQRESLRHIALLLPALTIFSAFWLLPMARLLAVGASGEMGISAYWAVVTDARYFSSLVSTVVLSATVTVATIIISGISGMFLQRNRFLGRSCLIAHQAPVRTCAG